MEMNAQQYDPYKYSSRASWPVIRFKAPFLVSVPDGLADLKLSITCRVPVALDRTVEAHCRAMGVSKSEWIRNAQLHLLSVEQKWLDENAK
jgi:hypothetical protein